MGGTDIWEGLAWWHAKNVCIHVRIKKCDGKDVTYMKNNSNNSCFLMCHHDSL